MEAKCPYCGSRCEVEYPRLGGTPGYVDVLLSRVGLVQLGWVEGGAVIILGMEGVGGRKLCFALDAGEFKEAYRDIGNLLGVIEARGNN